MHELAHQWFGDYVAVHHGSDIWLNEGFATYAEWLWSEREGFGTVQDNFDFWYEEAFGDPEDPFWDLVIGDPGPVQLFDFPVYIRGAMTLQQLRLEVGDGDFFRILRQWVAAECRRQWLDARVHPPVGENLRQGPWRPVRHLALHTGEA